MDEYDWFLKADDDTYVIVENLRFFLKDQNTTRPVYFGCKFKKFVDQGYMSGGAGYVLSKEALKRFVGQALPNSDICSDNNKGIEDYEMGRCLEAVGVEAGDSRDSLGKPRFFPGPPNIFLKQGSIKETDWYWDFIYYSHEMGPDCCSETAISFHYIKPELMPILDYFIYKLSPYGILSPEWQQISESHLKISQ